MTVSDGVTTTIQAIKAGMANQNLRWSEIGPECGGDIPAGRDHQNVVTVSPLDKVNKVADGLRLAGYTVVIVQEPMGQIVLCVHD